jgi:lysophospholipid acyltransferase (LPLAT)-like uncharacterized protein
MKLSGTQKKILRFIGLRISTFAVNALLKTIRIKIINDSFLKEIRNTGKNYIAAFWHGSMFVGWYLNKNSNCSALVSKSSDGDILAHTLKKWNYNVLRGSSHVGGKEALEEMISLLNQNYSIAITPDGPTGPIHKMKAGAVVASKKTQVPLFLVGIYCNRKISLKSWDNFEIPKPFSKVAVLYSDPIIVDASLNYDETSMVIENCEKILNQLQSDAAKIY